MLDEQIATNDGPSCTCYSEDECGSVITSTTSAPTTSRTGDNEPTTQSATTSKSSNIIATSPESDIDPTDDSAPTTPLATSNQETTTDRSIPTSTTPVNELTFPEMKTTAPTTADTATFTTDRL